jgi:hypothetical protein
MNRISQLQQRLSDHVHRPGDEQAGQAGWTITTTTGRYGFGARMYRDPRFDQRVPRSLIAGGSSARDEAWSLMGRSGHRTDDEAAGRDGSKASATEYRGCLASGVAGATLQR